MNKRTTLAVWLSVAALGLQANIVSAQTAPRATSPASAESRCGAATPTTRQSSLVNALSAERRYLDLPGFGAVAYYADPRGEGRPLVLTTSVNAAASAYEMKPIFDAYAGTRPVYVLEWPGFGSSARPDVKYSPELMTCALDALLAHLDQDVDVVALSLGAEFAARAAQGQAHIKSLALISPTGLSGQLNGSQRANAQDGGRELFARLKRFQTPLYGLLKTRWGLQYFLSKSFVGPVDPGLLNYSQQSVQQPGAVYAPIYFISGQLFTQSALETLYRPLSVPVLVIYDQDGYVDFERLPDFERQSNVSSARIVPSLGLPQFEKLPQLRAALDAFWKGRQ